MKPNLLRAGWGLVFLLLATNTRADPLNQWTWRFPNPQGYTLTAVTYGGGQFVAVGDMGTILTSINGCDWVIRTTGTFPFLRGVAYADGAYAAVGDGGVILISSNAITWTQITAPTSNTLHGISGDSTWRYDHMPQFLAVGDSGTAVICGNGTNWAVTPCGTTNSLYAATFGASGFYLVGANGTAKLLERMPGGWEIFDISGATPNNLYSVASDGGGTLAVGGDLTLNPFAYTTHYTNEIIYSFDDGEDWANQQWIDAQSGTQQLWYLSEFFILTGMTYGPQGFVAVGYTGYCLEYHPAVVMISATGTDWTELPSSTSEDPLSGVTYGNGLYVAVGDFGSIIVSTNAVNWNAVTLNRRGAIIAMASNTNLCIAASLSTWYSWGFPDFRTLVSTNGINWAVSTTGSTLPVITDIGCSGTLFVGVSANSIYSTSDGYNWHGNSSFANALHGVRYVNGQFVAVGDNGTIYSSIDGTNWLNRSVATTGTFNGIAYGNGVYAAAGSVSATSSDGVTWTLCQSNPPAIVKAVTYAKGAFVAAAYSSNDQYHPMGQLLTSLDGVSWQVQYQEPNQEAFSAVVYSGGLFVALSGVSGAVYTSTNALNWQPTGSSMPKTTYYPEGYGYWEPLMALGLFEYYGQLYPGCYTTAAAYKGTFFMAGAEGMLLQSGNTWKPATLTPSPIDSNAFRFLYNQQLDVPYRILASTNLLHWECLYTGIGSGRATNFDVLITSDYPTRFFRIVSP